MTTIRFAGQPGGIATTGNTISFADLSIDLASRTVTTPYGTYPLDDARFELIDNTTVRNVWSGAGKLVFILFGLFVIGLIGLAMREEEYTGTVSVKFISQTGKEFTAQMKAEEGLSEQANEFVNKARHAA